MLRSRLSRLFASRSGDPESCRAPVVTIRVRALTVDQGSGLRLMSHCVRTMTKDSKGTDALGETLELVTYSLPRILVEEMIPVYDDSQCDTSKFTADVATSVGLCPSRPALAVMLRDLRSDAWEGARASKACCTPIPLAPPRCMYKISIYSTSHLRSQTEWIEARACSGRYLL